MNRQVIFVLGAALALATPVPAQPEPELPPLAPLAPPRAQKKKQKKRKPAPSAQKAAPAQTVPELPLPAAPPTVSVLVRNDGLSGAAAPLVEQGLRGVLGIAPSLRAGAPLPESALQCTDDACLSAVASAQKIDRVLVASLASGTVTMRLLDVARGQPLAEEQDTLASPGEATARAEALACKLLVPAGCTGRVAIDAGSGLELALDGAPLSGDGQVAVGVHRLTVRAGGEEMERALPVAREGAPELHARLLDGKPLLLTADELKAREQARPQAAPREAVAALPAPARQGKGWTKPAGIAALALGGAAVATGAILGAKSRSDLNKAESAYRANGGAYRASDLDALSSGNSAAHRANALFVASAVLLAAGATLTFAF